MRLIAASSARQRETRFSTRLNDHERKQSGASPTIPTAGTSPLPDANAGMPDKSQKQECDGHAFHDDTVSTAHYRVDALPKSNTRLAR